MLLLLHAVGLLAWEVLKLWEGGHEETVSAPDILLLSLGGRTISKEMLLLLETLQFNTDVG